MHVLKRFCTTGQFSNPGLALQWGQVAAEHLGGWDQKGPILDSPVSARPTQAIPTAAALTAHPWGALSPSPLTPPSRTAPRSLPPASPGRSPPGSLGLRPHRPATDRRVLVSGPRVPSQVLEKMQPKRTWNQTARASPPSPVPGTRLHPSTWPRRGPMGSQDWKEPRLPPSDLSLRPKVSQDWAWANVVSLRRLPACGAWWLRRGAWTARAQTVFLHFVPELGALNLLCAAAFFLDLSLSERWCICNYFRLWSPPLKDGLLGSENILCLLIWTQRQGLPFVTPVDCVIAIILSNSTSPVFLGFLFRKQELQWIHSKLNFHRFQRDTQSHTKPRSASKNVQEVKAGHRLQQRLPAPRLRVSVRVFVWSFLCLPWVHRAWACAKEPSGFPQPNTHP